MKSWLENALSLRPALVGVALFGLAWVAIKELNVPNDELCCHVTPGAYYDQIFLSSLLVAASLVLLPKRSWGHVAALALGGSVLFESLFRDFWLLAKNAEVPRFSQQHFSLWWPNLTEGQLLQITLAGVIALCSMTALVRAVRGRCHRTRSN